MRSRNQVWIKKEDRLKEEKLKCIELDLENIIRIKLVTERENSILKTTFNINACIYKLDIIHYNLYKFILNLYNFKYLKAKHVNNNTELRNMVDRIIDEIYEKELQECKELGRGEILYLKYRKDEINTKRSCKILGDQGPEIYKIILSHNKIRLYKKRVELCISKNISECVKKLPIYISDNYLGKQINCGLSCENKMYINMDTIYATYIHMNMINEFNPKCFPCSPKCPECLQLNIRKTPTDNLDFTMWIRCIDCNLFYINNKLKYNTASYYGRGKCKGHTDEIYRELIKVNITDSNFIY